MRIREAKIPTPESVLVNFEREVIELGYEPALSSKVREARAQLKKALGKGADYEAMEKIKGRFMKKFRNDPLMEKFNYSRYAVFSASGEKNYY